MPYKPDLSEAHYPIEVRPACPKCGLYLRVPQFVTSDWASVKCVTCGHRSMMRKAAFEPRRLKISARGMVRLAGEAVVGKA